VTVVIKNPTWYDDSPTLQVLRRRQAKSIAEATGTSVETSDFIIVGSSEDDQGNWYVHLEVLEPIVI